MSGNTSDEGPELTVSSVDKTPGNQAGTFDATVNVGLRGFTPGVRSPWLSITVRGIGTDAEAIRAAHAPVTKFIEELRSAAESLLRNES